MDNTRKSSNLDSSIYWSNRDNSRTHNSNEGKIYEGDDGGDDGVYSNGDTLCRDDGHGLSLCLESPE